MAKKKGINKLYLIGGAGGTVAAVLIAVFVFGVGLDFVNPLFQEQTGLTVEQIQQNNDIAFQVSQIEGDLAPISEADLQPPTYTDPPDLPPLDPIDEPNPIDDLPDPIEDPPITNGTFSEDPPIDQICDELDLGCGTRAITLTSIVTKTDSSGVATVVEETFSVGQLAFFVEDISGIDFSTGRITIELLITPDRPTSLGFGGSGEMDVLIRGESVLPNKIPIKTDPLALGTGEPTRFLFGDVGSPDFTFSIAEHFDKFLNEQVSRLSFVVTFSVQEIVVQEVSCTPDECFSSEPGDTFGVTNLKVFSLDIARDDQKIIIVNEEGVEERIFPSDSRIVVYTNPKTPTRNEGAGWCRTFYSIFNPDYNYLMTYTNPAGTPTTFPEACLTVDSICTYNNVIGGCNISVGTIGQFSGAYTLAVVPAIALSQFTLIDSDGRLVTTALGGIKGKVFDYNTLTRNENYTMTIASPSISVELNYGKTQETQSYTCLPDYTIRHKAVGGFAQPQAGLPSGGPRYTWVDLFPIQPTSSTPECNFP